jgi:hypothetical protein
MKFDSFLICLNCCNNIVINRYGWWSPFNWEKISNGIICFGNSKGERYGANKNCDFYFEHNACAFRNGFKLNTLNDYVELYNFISSEYYIDFNYKSISLEIKKNENSSDPISILKSSNNFLQFLRTIGLITENDVFSYSKDNKLTFNYKLNSGAKKWLDKLSKKVKTEKMFFHASGVTFDGRQEILKKISENMDITDIYLKPELNKYDNNAIGIIFVDSNGEEVQIGYVPKKETGYNFVFNEKILQNISNINKLELKWIGEMNGIYGAKFCLEIKK